MANGRSWRSASIVSTAISSTNWSVISPAGMDAIGAALVLVEICHDVDDAFGSVDRQASWVGLCPGNNASAEKRKSGRM